MLYIYTYAIIIFRFQRTFSLIRRFSLSLSPYLPLAPDCNLTFIVIIWHFSSFVTEWAQFNTLPHGSTGKKIAFPIFQPNHKPQIKNIKILGRYFLFMWFLFSFAFAKHKFCAFREKKMLQKMESNESEARETNIENQQPGNAVCFWKINEFPRSQIDCQIDIKKCVFFFRFYWKCSVSKVQLSFNQRKHGNMYRSAYSDSCIAFKFLSMCMSVWEGQEFGQSTYWACVCVCNGNGNKTSRWNLTMEASQKAERSDKNMKDC